MRNSSLGYKRKSQAWLKFSVFASILGLSFSAQADLGSYYKEPEEGAFKVGFVAPQFENPFFVGVKLGIEKYCEERALICTIVDAKYDPKVQGEAVNKLINEGYQAILVTPIRSQEIAPLFNKAKARGIVTGSLAQTVPGSDLLYELNEYDYGYMIGEGAGAWAKNELNCVGKAVLVTQDNVQEVALRSEGILQALTEACPMLQVVERKAGDTPNLGEAIVTKVLAQHPDLNLVVATNDSGGIGAYQGLKKASPDFKHAVFSGDATREVIDLLKAPDGIYQGTVDLFPYQSGYQAVKYLVEMAVLGVPPEGLAKHLSYEPVTREAVLSGSYLPSY